MNKLVMLILIAWTSTAAQGQRKIPADELINDLKVLRTTIQELHPDLYRYTSKAIQNRAFDSLSRTINTDLTELEFYQKIAPAVALIKNGHTAARLSDNYYDHVTLLPLRLVSIDKRIYVKTIFTDETRNVAGFEILRINGVPIKDLILKMIQYVSLDGFNDDAKHKAVVEDDFAYYYNYAFGQHPYFELDLVNPKDQKEMKVKLNGMSHAEFNARYAQDTPFPWEVTQIDSLSTTLLRIGSFNNVATMNGKQVSFTSFLKQTFDEIQKQNVRNLIIDVKNDGGGELTNAILLYSYLADGPFQFTKEIEMASISPPTYIQYTNYNKALKFDPLEAQNIMMRDGIFILKKHFSMNENKPKKGSFNGNVYVIINGQTGSSAGSFAAYVHNKKRGKIVGAENRDNYTGFSAGIPVVLTLPGSGIKIYIPLRKFTYATGSDNGRGVSPDYPFTESYSDYFTDHSAEIRYVTTLIGMNK